MKSKQKAKVLLLGGGYTLSRVPPLFEPGECLITSRSEAKVAEFAQMGFRSAKVDLSEPESLEEVFERYPSLSVLVDSVPPARAGTPEMYVERTIRAIRSHSKVRRVIYLSTTGVFGEENGNWVDESTPCAPLHSQGEARLTCEKLYRELDIEVAILRLPAIYGPDRGIERALCEGTYKLIDDGKRWTNRIHVDDLSRVITTLVQRSNIRLPEILCVSDNEPTQQFQIVSDYCKVLCLPMPESRSYEDVKANGHHTMLSNQRVNNKRLREYLGVSLIYQSYRSWLECISGKDSDHD